MDVSPQADVIGQIEAYMIRIFVDYDVIRIPQPTAGVCKVRIRHREVKAIEPETRRAAACEAKAVAGAESAGEMAVFPRMIHMKSGVGAAGLVSHPLIAVHVRRVGVPGLFGLVHRRGRGVVGLSGWRFDRGRTMRWRLTRREIVILRSAASFVLAAVTLSVRNGDQGRCGEKCNGKFRHPKSLFHTEAQNHT
jgi:hypothetical protein